MTTTEPEPNGTSRSRARVTTRELGRALGEVAGAANRLTRPVTSWLRRALGPVGRVVSPLGWLLLAAAALSLLLCGLLGWAEFGFVGATLAAAFLIAVCFVFGRASYAVTIELNPRRVVAGEKAMGRMLVTNTAGRPALPTRIELPVGAGAAEFFVPRLGPAAEHEELFAVPTERRSLILAGPAVSVRGDQLGLLRRTTEWTGRVELFVHPRTTRLRATARGLVRDLEGQTTKTITDSDLAFHALRGYEPGDDIRNVHWRTSARTGALMVRQYQETRRSQLLVLFSAEGSTYASDDEFELGVSVMASIACQVIAEESALDVVWEGGALRHATPVALLDDSCRIEPVEGRYPDIRAFAKYAGRRLASPSLVVAVVGSQVPTQKIRALTTLYDQDAVVIAVRVAEGASARVDKLGNVMLATLGSLAQLAGLLEKAGR